MSLSWTANILPHSFNHDTSDNALKAIPDKNDIHKLSTHDVINVHVTCHYTVAASTKNVMSERSGQNNAIDLLHAGQSCSVVAGVSRVSTNTISSLRGRYQREVMWPSRPKIATSDSDIYGIGQRQHHLCTVCTEYWHILSGTVYEKRDYVLIVQHRQCRRLWCKAPTAMETCLV